MWRTHTGDMKRTGSSGNVWVEIKKKKGAYSCRYNGPLLTQGRRRVSSAFSHEAFGISEPVSDLDHFRGSRFTLSLKKKNVVTLLLGVDSCGFGRFIDLPQSQTHGRLLTWAWNPENGKARQRLSSQRDVWGLQEWNLRMKHDDKPTQADARIPLELQGGCKLRKWRRGTRLQLQKRRGSSADIPATESRRRSEEINKH